MSRAAAASATKGAQKAALKEKAETHAADLAMGLTSTMKKLMAADTLLCTVCQATQLGPKDKCNCPGGRSKPPADYDAKHELLAAAMAREKKTRACRARHMRWSFVADASWNVDPPVVSLGPLALTQCSTNAATLIGHHRFVSSTAPLHALPVLMDGIRT